MQTHVAATCSTFTVLPERVAHIRQNAMAAAARASRPMSARPRPGVRQLQHHAWHKPVVGLGASTRTPDSANFPLLRHLAASLLRVRRRRGQVTVAHLGRVGGPGRVRGRACLNACSCKHGRAYHEIVKLTLTQCIRMPQRPHADSGTPPPHDPCCAACWLPTRASRNIFQAVYLSGARCVRFLTCIKSTSTPKET